MLSGDESTAPSVVLQFRSRAEGGKKAVTLSSYSCNHS